METALCVQVWRDVAVKGFWLNVVCLCPLESEVLSANICLQTA